MIKMLSLLLIASLYINTASAEIRPLSPKSTEDDPSSFMQIILGGTLCVEGYVVFVKENIAIQMLNKSGKPLQCKGKKHSDIVN